jgi:undecaprenyl-diphosphatase
MNDIIQAIVFGIVQGLTEFLPVSSSGHLEIAKVLFGYAPAAGESMMMTVVLHFATALSTVVVFRKEIVEIFQGLLKPSEDREHFWFCVKILISMIPAAVIGILFDEKIEALFNGDMMLVGAMLLFTGVLLLLADRAKTTEKPVSVWNAVVIGIAQAVAILPGISRSGATISTSVLLGVDREKAAKFSFLMVVPLIFGKIAKDLLDSFRGEGDLLAGVDIVPLSVGFVAAFITGWLACLWMIRLVKACQLTFFSVYCFIVGTIAIYASYQAG